MAKKKEHPKRSLADPSLLAPLNSDDRRLITVVVETPKGSRNKYAFSPELGVFRLKRVLPAGMTFPYDFGFVPRTRADDGDPLDVLVLMDEAAFPGCVLECRPIGIIEGAQVSHQGEERNDRIVAIQKDAHSWADVKTMDDLGEQFCTELEEFFVDYHKLAGEKYRVIGHRGPKRIRKLIKSAME